MNRRSFHRAPEGERRQELIERMHSRRERDFGTGYGSSSGYASGRASYTRGWRPGIFKFG